MARVRQFANDLGISKNQAQNLINKGRSRKDGGSQILENTMKPVKAKKGKSVETPKEKPNRMYSNDPESAKKTTVQKLKTMGVLEKKDKTGKDKTEIINEDFSKKVIEANKKNKGGFPDLTGDGNVTKADVLKGRGVPGFARGGGMAIQGLGFRGVR